MMKKLIAVLLAMVMAFALVACGAASEPQESSTTQTTGQTPVEDAGSHIEEGLMEFTVIVVHADGSTKEFTYQTADKYVGPVLVEGGLIKGNEGPYGLEITEVDGEKAVYDEDKAYWAVYEGDEYAMQGIDTTPVADGATYKLVYTVA